MNKQRLESQRIIRIALGGAAAQLLLSICLIALGRWAGGMGLQAAGFLGVAGLFPWIWILLIHYLKGLAAEHQLTTPPDESEPEMEIASYPDERDSSEEAETDRELDEAAQWAAKAERIEGYIHAAQAFISPLFGVALALSLGWMGWVFFERISSTSDQALALEITPLQIMALLAGWSVIAFSTTRFLVLFARRSGTESSLAAGLKYVLALRWIGLLFLAGYGSLHFGWIDPLRVINFSAPVVMLLIGVETAFSLVLEFFRPKRERDEACPAFDSRLLGLLLRSDGMGHTLWEALDYQFGFEVSRSWFLRLCARSLWGWVVLAGGTLIVLSMIVIVEPNQEGLLFRFGQLRNRTLTPGLHWKAPWPMETVVLHDVTGIRRIHVGSHRPDTPGGSVYRKDTPILWSNMHGLTAEEYLVVAPPADTMEIWKQQEIVTRFGGTKPPSANLMGGDIIVEYRIADLRSFATASTNTEALFAQIAECETSRELFRYDVDALLGSGRIAAETNLLKRLKEVVRARNLGIDVLKIGFVGTHPPREVANSFHETIIARQERKTSIEDAHSYATRVKIEAAGTLDHANELIRAITAVEKTPPPGGDISLSRNHDKADILLLQAGGRVAETMSEARGYRWWRENEERGKAERFLRELDLLRIGPNMFPRWQYLSTLEQGLAQARKYVLLADREELVLRLNFINPADAMSKVTNSVRNLPTPPPWEDMDDRD